MDDITNNLIETLAQDVGELRGYENDLASRSWAQTALREIDRSMQDLISKLDREIMAEIHTDCNGEPDSDGSCSCYATQDDPLQDAFFDQDEAGGY